MHPPKQRLTSSLCTVASILATNDANAEVAILLNIILIFAGINNILSADSEYILGSARILAY